MLVYAVWRPVFGFACALFVVLLGRLISKHQVGFRSALFRCSEIVNASMIVVHDSRGIDLLSD